MNRGVLVIAGVVVALHAVEVLKLGHSETGTLLANSLQVFSSFFAATMAFLAFRRGRGPSRQFWILAGCGMAMWGVANLAWMYYENWLHVPVPMPSTVGFLYDLQGAFYALAVFQSEERDGAKIDFVSALDFTQISIVVFFFFFGLYYLPSLHGDIETLHLREVWIACSEMFFLIVAAAIRSRYARTDRMRRLYRGLAGFLSVYLLLSGPTDYLQDRWRIQTGAWLDLCWSLPFLVGAIWAANWKESAESTIVPTARKRTTGRIVLVNALYASAPLIILFQVLYLGTKWRAVQFSLMGVSIVCYALRLGLSELRQLRSAAVVQRQSHAMNSALDGMALVDGKGEYFYANHAYAQMMGYENPDGIIGKPWRQISNREDVERMETEIRESLQRNGKWFGPLTVHRSDGSTFAMEMAIQALPEGGVVLVSRDISDRRRAETARFEAETKYRTLVEQIAAISYIAELGLKGRWLYVSPQVEKIFGFTADEWLADSEEWIRHVPPEDHAVIEAAEESSQRGEPFQAEYRIVRKDGEVIWVSDTAVVVRGSETHPVMEGIIVDITERKRLEFQLQQSRKMEAVGRLAGGIAHDFNNLLTIIKGYTELALGRGSNQAELKRDIRRIEDASERATALVRQLLAFSRKQVLQPKALDLNSIVLGLEELLRRLIGEHISMKTLVSKDIGTVKADPGQIEQVIMNLVVNARDAMPNGGHLIVETANVDLDAAYERDHTSVQPGRYVMLAVTDTGMGMNAETKAHIFEPFYTTKGSGRGTGLGLSTVYGIVKQSNGYIWVYSEPGQGTSFKVYLPRVDEPADALPVDRRGTNARAGSETILLVEDDEAVRELARMVLTARGYQVVVADAPADAERICDRHPGELQLLLTDVVMPGMSGREIARRVTAKRPKIRVLYMSGYTDNVIAHGGLLEDGLAFLQKPFTPSVLAEKVREVLDGVVAAK